MLKPEEGEHIFEELDHSMSHVKKHHKISTHEDVHVKDDSDDFQKDPSLNSEVMKNLNTSTDQDVHVEYNLDHYQKDPSSKSEVM